jgi:uncharacterized protein (TIGR00266 family)
MEVQIINGPGNAAAEVQLGPSEELTAEGGSMIAMSGDMSITTTTHKKGKGSILKAAKRLLSGESFFLNHYTAGSQGGQVWLSTTLPGDMMKYELKNESLIVQGSSFVAAPPEVEVDMGWQGFKSLLSGESIFWLHLKGTGKVILNSFGAIYPVEVNGNHIVDTGHIVAFNETLDFKVGKAGKSWVSSILGGEGLVCHFHGQGTVWCQSHNPSSFGRILGPKLRSRG